MSNQPFDQTNQGNKPTKDVAADETKNVTRSAQQSGKHVAESAKGEAQELVGEAKGQAQDLLQQVRSEATSQVSAQQERVAGSLRTMSDQLEQISQGKSVESGTATNLISQTAGQVGQVAGWLENREPADLLSEVRRYARRNPGTFLAGAALLGLVGGRLTRGLQADNQRDQGHDRRHQSNRASQLYRGDAGYGYTERTPEYGYRSAYSEAGQVDRGYSAGDRGVGYTGERAGDSATYVSDQSYGDTAESRGQDRPGAGEIRR